MKGFWRSFNVNQKVYNFMNYVENSQGYFGEPVSYIGFPTSVGSGSAAYANFSMAISEESARGTAVLQYSVVKR